VVLGEEPPVVDRRVVANERVRLDTDTVTDQERVADTRPHVWRFAAYAKR
jgi:Domain of unknown function (DUF2382)